MGLFTCPETFPYVERYCSAMNSKLLLPLLVAGVLAGCDIQIHGLGDSQVVGKGPEKTDSRTTSGFRKIRISRAIHAKISIGQKDSVEIRAKKSLLPLVTTKVSGDELVITTTKDIDSSTPVEAVIQVKDLQSLDLEGAVMADLSGLKVDALELNLSGASTLNMKGDARNLKAILEGASQLTWKGSGNSADITAEGASQAELGDASLDSLVANAEGASTIQSGRLKTLDATASGASNIRYSGDPQVKRAEASGAANIVRR